MLIIINHLIHFENCICDFFNILGTIFFTMMISKRYTMTAKR